MSFVVRNNLDRFLSKLEKLGNYAENAGDLIAEKGVKIARDKWGSEAVIRKEGGELEFSIIAEDPNKVKPTIAYKEFGTGIKGEGTYEGILPTKPIRFTTGKGVSQQKWVTPGWQYYYRYKQTSMGKPHEGRVAQMLMFTTAKELREYVRTRLQRDLRKRKVK